MYITNVSVMPLKNGKFNCIAICQFTVDNTITITGLKLYEKNGARYLVFPKNVHNKKGMSYCQPTSVGYVEILNAVLKEYNKVTNDNILENCVNIINKEEHEKENKRLQNVAEILDSQGIDDVPPDLETQCATLPCMDNEKAKENELKILNIDVMNLLFSNKNMDDVKSILTNKYKNANPEIKKLLTQYGCFENEKEETY